VSEAHFERLLGLSVDASVMSRDIVRDSHEQGDVAFFVKLESWVIPGGNGFGDIHRVDGNTENGREN
jgi:hypothetical protein